MKNVDKAAVSFICIAALCILATVIFPVTRAMACDDYQQPKVGDYQNGSTWDSNAKQINGGQGAKK